MAAGVHQAWAATGPDVAGVFNDGQGVHVGAQAQGLAALAALEATDHTGATYSCADLIAPVGELAGHQRGRAVLLKGQLGVGVDVAAQANELAHARR